MSDTAVYEKDTIELIRDITQDWDSSFEGEITGETRIAEDLEFDSLDVVHLITAIEQHYKRSDFAFENLLMENGQYVQDLTVAQITQFVQNHVESN